MAARSRDPATFWTQADALLRKNLTFQKRNRRANIRLIVFPVILCVLIRVLQEVINTELDKPENRCGCVCTSMNRDGQCESRSCGLEYSSLDQSIACPVPSPPKWPPILQIPAPEYRVVRTDFLASMDLPNESCRRRGSCPAITFFTGSNRSLGQFLTGHMLPNSIDINSSNVVGSLANMVLGSPMYTWPVNFIEPAFVAIYPVYTVQHQCIASSAIPVLINQSSVTRELEIQCVQGLYLWRNGSSEVNTELYRGYRKGNPERKIDEFVAGYDFLNSNQNNFNISIWYNSTYSNYSVNSPMSLVRIPRSVNLASNSYLKFLKGLGTKILFEFVNEMPKPETEIRIDLSSLIGTLFFTWVVLQLFPVVLVSLVYEKQHNLRLMMKMHGLGDGPYWMISYFYFLIISLLYIITFVIFGSVIGLRFFTLNDYSLQFVFYLVYINLQVSMAFLVAAMFSNFKTAQVVSYIVVFGTGLLGGFLFEAFVEDTSFPRSWIIVLELYPGFSLYRGLYEFGQYAFTGRYMGTHGMRWGDLNDSSNGLREVLLIMFVEWLVILIVAYYTDKIGSLGCRKNPLLLFHNFKKQPFLGKPNLQRQESNLQRQDPRVSVQLDKPDVCQEAEKVQQLLLDPNQGHAIICDSLKKVYPGKDGNPAKFAVRELSLALNQGECFGMLGPNGAGKTSFINMMIGLTRPTSGTASIQGLDIQTEMDAIYTSMGVCPQHDLLWDILTGREHLLFYGRLKNLKGSALAKAVEESLRSMNLFHGGVADKLTEKYSGGMKRRLSVAISLIGDPKVVYMDEPSTGLDPASRRSLWNVIKSAKEDRAIILTTHSMEEAEVLCDRLGIFVDGSFQCIGNPKELKARYGGSYIFSITTPSNLEEEVKKLVRTISSSANRVYQIAGTQKFELPKTEVRIADVFEAVEEAKNRFRVSAWGLADTTLEDVFIKVARGAQTLNLVQ